MQAALPQAITSTELAYTSVALEALPLWDSGSVPYLEGSEVIWLNQIWIAAVDNSDQPDIGYTKDPRTWVRQGWVNRYRMFNDGVDSQTVDIGNISVTIDQVTTNTVLGVLRAEGGSVTVTMTDPEEGLVMNETKSLVDVGVENWWQFFYSEYETFEELIFKLPAYPNAPVEISIDGQSPTSQVAAGRVVLGVGKDLGVMVVGTSVQNLSLSDIGRDGFGNLTINKNRTVKLVDYRVVVDSVRVSSVNTTLRALDATETLFIGSVKPGYGATVTLGVIETSRITYDDYTESNMTLTVQGI